MSVATQKRQLNAAMRELQQCIQDHLALLDDETRQDFKTLIDMLGTEDDEAEKESIAETLLEIICPQIIQQRVIEELTESEEAEARERLTNYRRLIGKGIRERREQLKMTQLQLAERVGVRQNYISRLERGDHVPTETTMKRIAKALKTTAAKLDPGFDD